VRSELVSPSWSSRISAEAEEPACEVLGHAGLHDPGEDLTAIGFRLGPGDNRWAVRPAPAPNRPPAEPADVPADFDEGWVWIGDQRMFVVGYTPGGAPYGWIDTSIGSLRTGSG
jgi:hypothetical protein